MRILMRVSREPRGGCFHLTTNPTGVLRYPELYAPNAKWRNQISQKQKLEQTGCLFVVECFIV